MHDAREAEAIAGAGAGPATEARRRRADSFGAVAEAYDRYRPSPPLRAIDWLLPVGAGTVLDVGAGTGALSRKLLQRADEVIAVEPDGRMRAVLARRLPAVRVLAGRAEELPLPDASVDAVLVASAWHWLDRDAATAEFARVLRGGGVLGIVWTGPDRSSPVAAALWRAPDERPLPDAVVRDRHRPEDVRLPAGAPFGRPEITRLRSTWRVSQRRLLGLLGTYSSVITLPPERRERLLRRARLALDAAAVTDGRGRIPVPLSCRCWRAVRL